MNNVAISPYIGMHALQIQNVKRESVKKLNIQELNMNNVVAEKEQEQYLPSVEKVEIVEKNNTNMGTNMGTNLADLPLPESSVLSSSISGAEI